MIIWLFLRNFKNCIIFGGQNATWNLLIDSLVDYFYNWFVFRNRKISISHVSWMLNPIVSIPM